MALTTENSGNLRFQDSSLNFFTGTPSLIGRTADELRNGNEVVVADGTAFPFTLSPRNNGGNDIVTENGTVSRKAKGKVRGFRLDKGVLIAEDDESKATHAFWVSDGANRIVTVEGKSYITAPAVV